MTRKELAAKIDHTILKPEASRADVERVVMEAREIGAASACVSPCWVPLTASILAGTSVKTCTVAGFPHGTSKPMIKAIEATSAIKDGAEEVDVVANIAFLLAGDFDAAKAELLEFARAARATRRDVVLKVIVESAALMQPGGQKAEDTIALACRAVRESGCDFIKTSTGFHPAGGASVEAIRLMKKYGQGLQIKASGGIRDLAGAMSMLDAGANRLGMSASVAVLNQLQPR